MENDRTSHTSLEGHSVVQFDQNSSTGENALQITWVAKMKENGEEEEDGGDQGAVKAAMAGTQSLQQAMPTIHNIDALTGSTREGGRGRSTGHN